MRRLKTTWVIVKPAAFNLVPTETIFGRVIRLLRPPVRDPRTDSLLSLEIREDPPIVLDFPEDTRAKLARGEMIQVSFDALGIQFSDSSISQGYFLTLRGDDDFLPESVWVINEYEREVERQDGTTFWTVGERVVAEATPDWPATAWFSSEAGTGQQSHSVAEPSG